MKHLYNVEIPHSFMQNVLVDFMADYHDFTIDTINYILKHRNPEKDKHWASELATQKEFAEALRVCIEFFTPPEHPNRKKRLEAILGLR